jgi:hypothetical protein
MSDATGESGYRPLKLVQQMTGLLAGTQFLPVASGGRDLATSVPLSEPERPDDHQIGSIHVLEVSRWRQTAMAVTAASAITMPP